jgi:hypothetical protein
MTAQDSLLLRRSGLVVYTTGLLVLLFVVRHVVLVVVHRQRARRLKCRDLPVRSNGFPFGLPSLRRLLRADSERRFPQYLQEINKEDKLKFGRHTQTVDSYMLGQRQIMTTDPANVRAILAGQFKEFGLGRNRNNCLALLQGYGVVNPRESASRANDF